MSPQAMMTSGGIIEALMRIANQTAPEVWANLERHRNRREDLKLERERMDREERRLRMAESRDHEDRQSRKIEEAVRFATLTGQAPPGYEGHPLVRAAVKIKGDDLSFQAQDRQRNALRDQTQIDQSQLAMDRDRQAMTLSRRAAFNTGNDIPEGNIPDRNALPAGVAGPHVPATADQVQAPLYGYNADPVDAQLRNAFLGKQDRIEAATRQTEIDRQRELSRKEKNDQLDYDIKKDEINQRAEAAKSKAATAAQRAKTPRLSQAMDEFERVKAQVDPLGIAKPDWTNAQAAYQRGSVYLQQAVDAKELDATQARDIRAAAAAALPKQDPATDTTGAGGMGPQKPTWLSDEQWAKVRPDQRAQVSSVTNAQQQAQLQALYSR